MPRGKKVSLDNKLSELNEKLAKKESEVAALKTEIKEIENQKRAEMLTKVEEVAKKKGITVDALLESLIK
jgi:phage shock protein A